MLTPKPTISHSNAESKEKTLSAKARSRLDYTNFWWRA